MNVPIQVLPSNHDEEDGQGRHPPLPHRGCSGRPRRPAGPPRAHPASAAGARRRLGLRYSERLAQRGARGVEVLRLACRRSPAERAPAVPHRDRRTDDPLHPRPLEGGERDPAAARAQLPGHRDRLPRDDRPARRPGRARRQGRGCLLGRHPVAAGLRLQHPGRRPRLDDGARCPHLRQADARPRLRELRRARQ